MMSGTNVINIFSLISLLVVDEVVMMQDLVVVFIMIDVVVCSMS